MKLAIGPLVLFLSVFDCVRVCDYKIYNACVDVDTPGVDEDIVGMVIQTTTDYFNSREGKGVNFSHESSDLVIEFSDNGVSDFLNAPGVLKDWHLEFQQIGVVFLYCSDYDHLAHELLHFLAASSNLCSDYDNAVHNCRDVFLQSGTESVESLLYATKLGFVCQR